MHLLPGNPAAMMLSPEATQEEIEALSEKWFKPTYPGSIYGVAF